MNLKVSVNTLIPRVYLEEEETAILTAVAQPVGQLAQVLQEPFIPAVPSRIDLTVLEGTAKKTYRLCNPEGDWCELTDKEKMHWKVVASETILTYFNKGECLDASCC